MVLFAYFDPLIVMLLVQFAIYLATEPAGEVESNLVDLLLARPMPRHVIVTPIVAGDGHWHRAVMSGAMHGNDVGGVVVDGAADVQWPDARTALQSQRAYDAHRVVLRVRGAGGIGLDAPARRCRSALSASSRSRPTWSSFWSRSGRRLASSPASRRFTTTTATGILTGTAQESQNLAVLGAIALCRDGGRLLEVSTARPVRRVVYHSRRRARRNPSPTTASPRNSAKAPWERCIAPPTASSVARSRSS